MLPMWNSPLKPASLSSNDESNPVTTHVSDDILAAEPVKNEASSPSDGVAATRSKRAKRSIITTLSTIGALDRRSNAYPESRAIDSTPFPKFAFQWIGFQLLVAQDSSNKYRETRRIRHEYRDYHQEHQDPVPAHFACRNYGDISTNWCQFHLVGWPRISKLWSCCTVRAAADGAAFVADTLVCHVGNACRCTTSASDR